MSQKYLTDGGEMVFSKTVKIPSRLAILEHFKLFVSSSIHLSKMSLQHHLKIIKIVGFSTLCLLALYDAKFAMYAASMITWVVIAYKIVGKGYTRQKLKTYNLERSYLGLIYLLLGATFGEAYAILLLAQSQLEPICKIASESYRDSKILGNPVRKSFIKRLKEGGFHDLSKAAAMLLGNPKREINIEEVVRRELLAPVYKYLNQVNSRLLVFVTFNFLFPAGLLLISSIGTLPFTVTLYLFTLYLFSIPLTSKVLIQYTAPLVRRGSYKLTLRSLEFLWALERHLKQGFPPLKAIILSAEETKMSKIYKTILKTLYSNCTWSDATREMTNINYIIGVTIKIIFDNIYSSRLALIINRIANTVAILSSILKDIENKIASQRFTTRIAIVCYAIIGSGLMRMPDIIGQIVTNTYGPNVLPVISLLATSVALVYSTRDKYIWAIPPIIVFLIFYKLIWGIII